MNLTPRQQQVIDGLVAGLSNKDIGKQAGMTPRTVKKYLTRAAYRNGLPRLNRVKLARLYTENVRPLPETLSPRKRQIARLVIGGLSNKEIASQLGTTENVVKNYMRDILDITGCWSRLELACRYL